MLFVLKGTDRTSLLRRIEVITREAKLPEGSEAQFNDSVTAAAIDPLFSESLFGERTVAVFDGLLRYSEEVRASLLSRVRAMAASENVFVLIDELWSAETLTLFKEQGVTLEQYSPTTYAREANPFTVSDAIMARDKKTAWLMFTTLLSDGLAAEELHGTIFWAVKSMLLCKEGGYGKTEQALAMKPYAYQKAGKGATKYSLFELTQYTKTLIDLLEQTRKQGGDLGVALEQLILISV